MRTKLIAFTLGLISGGLVVFVILTSFVDNGSLNSPTGRALSDRLETIPIESICSSISSGKQIMGEDHVIVWSDHKRYLVTGWRVDKSGIPVFYWTGAGLPTDVPGCKG